MSLFLGALASGYSDSPLAAAVATLIGTALVAPLAALAASTMYFELQRIRREGGGHGEPVPAEPAGPGSGPTSA